MPPKRKPENRGLPSRWTFSDGAYYYIPPKNLRHLWEGKSWFRLGKTLAEAYQKWGERVQAPRSIVTVNELFDEMIRLEFPDQAPATATNYKRYIPKLRPTFGAMRIEDVEPEDAKQYVKLRTKKRAAQLEVEFLRAALTQAFDWGLIKKNKLLGELKFKKRPARDRYVEDWELVELLSLQPRKRKGSLGMVQAYLRLKLLTGLRQRDLLLMTVSDLQDDGIHVKPAKTQNSSGKRMIYEWTPALRAAVEALKAVRPALSPYLVCDRKGKCYVTANGKAQGFNNLWQNCMARVLAETKVVQRFTEHDLRGKVASDAASLQRATELLGAVDEALVRRVYRRKPTRIQPAN